MKFEKNRERESGRNMEKEEDMQGSAEKGREAKSELEEKCVKKKTIEIV